MMAWAAPACVAAQEEDAEQIVVAQVVDDVDESSVGGQILNPYVGEEITDRQPMIGVKLPQLDPPIAPTTIMFFVDGSDVTAETNVSTEYLFYTPQIPLKLGNHNVRITYKDTAGTDQPSVQWDFTVVERIVTRVVAPPVEQKPSTTGRLNLQFEDIHLNKAIRPSTVDEADIRYPEALNTTANLSFTSKFYGKTLKGSYQRTVEQITGRANDYFRFDYMYKNDMVTIGDRPVTSRDFSELTMNGVRLRGVYAIHRLNPKYLLTWVNGRTREPHNGRYKRYTNGVKINTKTSKNHEVGLILLRSAEHGQSTSTLVPEKDTIAGLNSAFTYNKHWMLNSEFVYDNHTERGTTSPLMMGKDAASKYFVTYTSTRWSGNAGRRSIGPRFTPTTLGTFTEADREGTYGSIQYKPSSKFQAKTFYDAYHNNLHHNANTNDFTDKSTNSASSITLNYPHLPMITARYSKLYIKTDAQLGQLDTNRSESTNANFMANKQFNDLGFWNGNSVVFMFQRYDLDRQSYGLSGTSTVNSKTNLRNDTRNWTFTTRYKAFALFTYNTIVNKSYSYGKTQSTSGNSTTTSTFLTTGKTNTDRYGLQLNIKPFKFITNLNYKRTGRKSITTSTTITGSAPMEKQASINFIYYLDQSRKINFEIEDYDYEYRVTTRNKSYDEQIFRMGYTMDF